MLEKIEVLGAGDGLNTVSHAELAEDVVIVGFDCANDEEEFFGDFLVGQPLREQAENGKGDIVVVPGTAVEFLTLNFSDPNTEVDGQKSQWQTPHPFLSDPAVREALALGIDRQSISERLYFGPPGEPPTSNILLGIAGATSPNTT